MILVIGEILFDIFPAYKRIGGAPFNFAFHLKKLGFPVRFVSRVGNDGYGKEIRKFLNLHGFDLQDIQTDPDHMTGQVAVTFHPEEGHVFAIAKNTAYDHMDFHPIRQCLSDSDPDLIYFGTLIQRTKKIFDQFQQVFKKNLKQTKVFCDINLRPGCYNRQVLDASLKTADILKLNDEELVTIMEGSGGEGPYESLVEQLMKTYEIQTLILTMGNKGSYWSTPHGHFKMGPGHTRKIVDTVGAGDAYAALSAAGILRNLPLENIVPLASEFAARVCSVKGALIEDVKIYGEFKQRLEKSHVR